MSDVLTDGLSIRVARAADEPALAALEAATWSPAGSPGPPPDDRAFFTERHGPDGTLVASVDGTVVGFVQLASPTSLKSNRHVLEIHGLAVDPAWQRRGVAGVLLVAARDHAAASGARRLTLRVLATNTGAQALYRAAGFIVEGTRHHEFFLGGRYVDDVFMALAIGRDYAKAADGMKG
jgi:ribosomal protein S18 acetylase RimI-like enzyme